MPSLVHDTDWSAAPNTSAVSAGSALYDGWIDVAGSIWSIASGKLVGTTTDSAGYNSKWLLRPSGEDLRDSQIVTDVPAGILPNLGASDGFNGTVLRYSTGQNNYLCQPSQTNVQIFAIVGGSPSALNGSGTAWSGTYDPTHTYQVAFSANGASPTTLAVTVTDTTTSTVVATVSLTDSSSALQVAGTAGHVTWVRISGTAVTNFVRSRTYDLNGSSLAAGSLSNTALGSTTATNVSAVATGGTAPYTYQWYRSTSAGFTPGGGNIIGGATSLTLNDTGLSASTTYYYKVISTDNASATVTSSQLTITTTSGSPTAGAATVSSSTASATNVSVDVATGGTSPYTYQWYRDTTSGFTPGGGNILSGATSRSLTDSTVAGGTQYFYKNIVTDNASLTATSNQVSATPWSTPYSIGFVGDSITDGQYTSSRPGTVAGASLQSLRAVRAVTATNQGVSGSATLDWVSGGSLMNAADTAFTSASTTIVSIMLGHNDAAGGVAAATYGSRLSGIVTHFTGQGKTVILNYPMGFTTPSGLPLLYNETSLALLISYQSQINALVNGTTVLLGDILASRFFASRPDLLVDGIHPSDAGQAILGQMWATAIDRALNPALGSGAHAIAY